MTTKRQGLDAALDAIVFKWRERPNVDFLENPKKELLASARRLRETAGRRASALRKAAKALRRTHSEGWLEPDKRGSAGLPELGWWYRVREFKKGRTVALPATIEALETSALIHELSVPEGIKHRPGRKSDVDLRLLVLDVALACLEHGVMFKDSPDNDAAHRLNDVLRRVPWASAYYHNPLNKAGHARSQDSKQGLRRWLREARDIQQAANRRAGVASTAEPKRTKSKKKGGSNSELP